MLLKSILVFLVTLMVIAINMPTSIISQLGFEPDILKGALLAWIITGLIVYLRLALIVIILSLVAAANAPPEFAERVGYDRTVVLATLIAVVLAPRVASWFDD